MKISFEIPGLPKRANQLINKHYGTRLAKAERQRWHKDVGICLLGKIPKAPYRKANLILERHSSSCPDPDGLVISFKYIVDALVHYRVIVDDRFTVIGMPEYRWKRAKRLQGKVKITVIGIE